MKLIVGLGNVGTQYEMTPHNVGFAVIDQLAGQLSDERQATSDGWETVGRIKADVLKTKLGDEEVVLAKPTTMMNLSGGAVSKLAQFYRIKAEDIWIIHDELDLVLGRLKISSGGGMNGHNGLLSITEQLGHNRFWQFKVGVDGRVGREIPGLAYVLKPYDGSELQLVHKSVDMTVEAVKLALSSGLERARKEYNKKVVEPLSEEK